MTNCNTLQRFTEEAPCVPLPLAVAFVEFQEVGKVYKPEQALQRGTMFPELDKPFTVNISRN